MVFGKIFARKIHAGMMTLADVPEKYKAVTIQAYKLLYGIEPEE